MDELLLRERCFVRAHRYFRIFYCALSCALALVYALRSDAYHFFSTLGTLAVPLGLWLFYRLTRLRPVRQLDLYILAFALLAYTLGTCLDLYRLWPGYDKLVHGLSGVLTSTLCIALFLGLRPNHRLAPDELALAMLFTFFGSMAVAGLWEISEYGVWLATGRDVQHVLDTGVADTMQDMIVCMLGTLATLPALARMARGRFGFIGGAAQTFAHFNFGPARTEC